MVHLNDYMFLRLIMDNLAMQLETTPLIIPQHMWMQLDDAHFDRRARNKLIVNIDISKVFLRKKLRIRRVSVPHHKICYPEHSFHERVVKGIRFCFKIGH